MKEFQYVEHLCMKLFILFEFAREKFIAVTAEYRTFFSWLATALRRFPEDTVDTLMGYPLSQIENVRNFLRSEFVSCSLEPLLRGTPYGQEPDSNEVMDNSDMNRFLNVETEENGRSSLDFLFACLDQTLDAERTMDSDTFRKLGFGASDILEAARTACSAVLQRPALRLSQLVKIRATIPLKFDVMSTTTESKKSLHSSHGYHPCVALQYCHDTISTSPSTTAVHGDAHKDRNGLMSTPLKMCAVVGFVPENGSYNNSNTRDGDDGNEEHRSEGMIHPPIPLYIVKISTTAAVSSSNTLQYTTAASMALLLMPPLSPPPPPLMTSPQLSMNLVDIGLYKNQSLALLVQSKDCPCVLCITSLPTSSHEYTQICSVSASSRQQEISVCEAMSGAPRMYMDVDRCRMRYLPYARCRGPLAVSSSRGVGFVAHGEQRVLLLDLEEDEGEEEEGGDEGGEDSGNDYGNENVVHMTP